MNEVLQEIAVVVIVILAFAFLVQRLTGWPKLSRPQKNEGQRAVLGHRLAAGLKKAAKAQED